MEPELIGFLLYTGQHRSPNITVLNKSILYLAPFETMAAWVKAEPVGRRTSDPTIHISSIHVHVICILHL